MERIKIIGELDLKREQDRRIYEPSGLAPTLRAENHDVKILVGIIQNMDGYSDDDKTRQDKTRQDKCLPQLQNCQVVVLGQMDNTLDNTFESANRVYDKNGLCSTIPTCAGGGIQPKVVEEIKCCVAMRGRNPDNPSDRTRGAKMKQRLEMNKDGLVNTLTTVQKDNLLLENGLSSTLAAGTQAYRIRKLTPKECWRLMGYTDKDFEKAAQVNSNTQLYKQAGNAIVKQVLMAIFEKMIK